MRIAIAADHAGFDLKQHLVTHLTNQGHDVLDLGVASAAVRSDYPDVAQAVGQAVLEARAERGIVVCGSGIGACIAANKLKGIYASIAHDTYSAAQGVEHDNMNVLCLGGRIIGTITAEAVAEAFLKATFNNVTGRYAARFEKVRALEER